MDIPVDGTLTALTIRRVVDATSDWMHRLAMRPGDFFRSGSRVGRARGPRRATWLPTARS